MAFVYRMDNLEFSERMEELINRSNQLNYTESRIAPGTMRDLIQDLDNVVLSAFVWDKYGYYGLVGVAVLASLTLTLDHFAFSCRIMHMGVEDAMMRAVVALDDYRIDPGQLRKPLPAQSSKAITVASYGDREVRKRILAAEAPRDWSKISLRIMADCQSGAFHHYSRFRDIADHDNWPRLFSLPMMRTGEYAQQDFPRCLVYTPATDYARLALGECFRDAGTDIDIDIYKDCAERFTHMVIAGNHNAFCRCPPQDLETAKYLLYVNCDVVATRARHPILNDLWREIARRVPSAFHSDRAR